MSRISRAGGAFSPVTMVALALVAIVAMAGLGVVSAYAPELKTGNDGGDHALSQSAVGYAGIVKLLRTTGVPVALSRGPVGPSASDSLLVTTPPIGAAPDQVGDRVDAPDGPILIVLPKWNVMPEARRRGWVSTIGPLPVEDVLEVMPEHVRSGLELTRRKEAARVQLTRPDGQPVGRSVRVDYLQTMSGEVTSGSAWIPVVVDPSGGVVIAMRRDSRIYVLADPDLINTQGIKSLAGAETAVAVLDLLRAEGSPVIFDLTLHGFQRTRSLLRLMLEPPLIGVTLLLAALAALAGFQAVVRFGPARESGRTVALGKRALADNTAGLVRLARREHRMALPYALLIRATVARAIGAPRSLSELELDAFLDRVGAMTGVTAPYSTLAAAAAAAKTPHDLMLVARDLHRWRQELTLGRQ